MCLTNYSPTRRNFYALTCPTPTAIKPVTRFPNAPHPPKPVVNRAYRHPNPYFPIKERYALRLSQQETPKHVKLASSHLIVGSKFLKLALVPSKSCYR